MQYDFTIANSQNETIVTIRDDSANIPGFAYVVKLCRFAICHTRLVVYSANLQIG